MNQIFPLKATNDTFLLLFSKKYNIQMSSGVAEATYQTPKLPRNFKGGKNKPYYPQYSPFDYDKSTGQKRWDKDLALYHFQRGVVTCGTVMSSPAPKGKISYDSFNAPNKSQYNPSRLTRMAGRQRRENEERYRVSRMLGRGSRQPCTCGN